MSAELDPIFVRALHLLHSRHPKSLEQLCALRDELLGKKLESSSESKRDVKDVQIEVSSTQPSTTIPKTELATVDQGDTNSVLRDITDPSMSSLKDEKEDITETVEVESSSLSAQTKDCQDDEVIETVEELGSSFLETLEELSSSSLLLTKRKKSKLDIDVGKSTVEELDMASRESSPDHEISPELGIHCIICMSGKSSMVGNQLVECHECHEHYHQNCHKPNITDQSINDPRHVWYCSTCSKRMREATSTTTTTKPKPSISPGLSFKSPTQSFKPSVRVDGKPPSFSPGSSSVNQSFSIPSLTGGNSSGGVSNLKSSSNSYPSEVARNSMKRLQMVKKKAAAKNQQRFTKR